MSYTKMIIHCVWSTKERIPTLSNKEKRDALLSHIKSNATEKNIVMVSIGGYSEHIHTLLLLGKNQSISQVLQLLKGEASRWYNSQYGRKLEWQDDYFAVSISQSQIDNVKRYIDNQEEHHHKKTFQEEYQEFMKKYSF